MFHGWLHYWSYYLAPFGLTGMYLAGRKNKPAYGWLLSCFTQLLWLAYAVTTAQFGFIPGTLGYLVIYIKNWRTNRAPATKETRDRRHRVAPLRYRLAAHPGRYRVASRTTVTLDDVRRHRGQRPVRRRQPLQIRKQSARA